MLKNIFILAGVCLSLFEASVQRDRSFNSQERFGKTSGFSKSLKANLYKENLTEIDISKIELFMLKQVRKYTKTSDYVIKRSTVLYDFDDNPFVLTEFNKGYGIYSLAASDFTELSPFGESPYAMVESDFDDLRYVFMNGYYFKSSVGDRFFNVCEPNKPLNEIELSSLKSLSTSSCSVFLKNKNYENMEKILNSSSDKESSILAEPNPYDTNRNGGGTGTGKNDPSQGIITAKVEVPYSWYFKYNTNRFPRNDGSICGYVAASLILGYNEFFKSPGYFSQEQVDTYISFGVGTFGKVVPSISDDFPKRVWGKDIGGSTPSTIQKAIDSFLEGKKKTYDHYNYVSMFANVYDPIKDGVPAIYFGNFETLEPHGDHAVVAYGSFDDGKLLCHWGWKNTPGCSQVITNKLGLFNQGGVYALYNKSDHVHKMYFIDENRQGRCGCGEKM